MKLTESEYLAATVATSNVGFHVVGQKFLHAFQLHRRIQGAEERHEELRRQLLRLNNPTLDVVLLSVQLQRVAGDVVLLTQLSNVVFVEVLETARAHHVISYLRETIRQWNLQHLRLQGCILSLALTLQGLDHKCGYLLDTTGLDEHVSDRTLVQSFALAKKHDSSSKALPGLLETDDCRMPVQSTSVAPAWSRYGLTLAAWFVSRSPMITFPWHLPFK